MHTDSIADMLTRIRNATMARHRYVDMPGSKMRRRIAEILQEEGFVDGHSWTDDNKQGILHLTLKYDELGYPVIEGVERISKPGRRVYTGKEDAPRVRSGLAVVVLSTSAGVMTGREARERGIGGEVLCAIW